MEPKWSIPCPVIDDNGAVVLGPVVCGRRTAADLPCTTHRQKYSPACFHHVTGAEKWTAKLMSRAADFQEDVDLLRSNGIHLDDHEVRKAFRAYRATDRIGQLNSSHVSERESPIWPLLERDLQSAARSREWIARRRARKASNG